MPEESSLFMKFRAVLDRPILDQRLIYIDVWSLVHLCTALLLGYILARLLRQLWALATAIALILAYEVIELALVNVLFAPETPVDTIWDVILGFVGAFAAIRLGRNRGGSQSKRSGHKKKK